MGKVIWVFLTIVCIFIGTDGIAQGYKYIFVLGDSLETDSQNKILVNNFKLYNISNRVLHMGMSIRTSENWQVIGENRENFTFSLNTTDTLIIPLNLRRTKQSAAGWQTVEIKVFNTQIIDTQTYYYRIGIQEESKLIVQGLDEPIEIDGEESVILPLYIRNSGNVPQDVRIQWQHTLFKLNEYSIISLAPGADTMLQKSIKIPSDAFKRYSRHTVAVEVGSDGQKRVVSYEFSKAKSSLKQHKSAYSQIPLHLRTGVISVGDQFSYYFGVSGSYIFNKHNDLQFFYQSKQLGNVMNTLQQNPFSIRYRHKKWVATAGQVAAPFGFQVYGQGFSLAYLDSDKSEFSVTGILHRKNDFFQSDNFTARGRYQFKSLVVSHEGIVNIDHMRQVNSYLLNNEVGIINTKKVNFSLLAGVGMEEFSVPAPVKGLTFGYGGGYNFFLKAKSLEAASTFQYYSPDMPGFYKGYLNHNHSINWKKENRTVGIFYSSSFIQQNIYRDSLFNSDILSYNIDHYGINTGWSNKGLSVNAGIGMMNGGSSFSNLSNFLSGNLNVNWAKGDKSLSLILRNGFGKDPVTNTNQYVSINSLSLNTRFLMLSANYNRFPDGTESKGNGTESINGLVGTNFAFIDRRLFCNINYNVFKTLQSAEVRHGFGGSLSYKTKTGGFLISLTGNLPVTGVDGELIPLDRQRNVTLNISKSLNIPVLVDREYQKLTLLIYHDLNNNGLRDSGDSLMSGVKLTIGSEPFITNRHGLVRYKNIEAGIYAVSFVNTNVSNLIPAGSPVQYVEVEKNTHLEIPFKAGRELKGSVNIKRDSFSKVNFTPDGIKVVAIDSVGNKYYTVADKNGNFSFSLPAGAYNVGLTASAFEGSDFKPKRYSFDVNLLENSEVPEVNFIVIERSRRVRKVEFD